MNFIEQLQQDYSDVVETCEKAEAFLDTVFDTLSRGHMLSYGNSINNLTSKISAHLRTLSTIKIGKTQQLKTVEREVLDLEPNLARKDMVLDPKWVDIDSEIQYIEALEKSLGTLNWSLKSSRDFYSKIYEGYAVG